VGAHQAFVIHVEIAGSGGDSQCETVRYAGAFFFF
jgi:hypothetical protein